MIEHAYTVLLAIAVPVVIAIMFYQSRSQGEASTREFDKRNEEQREAARRIFPGD